MKICYNGEESERKRVIKMLSNREESEQKQATKIKAIVYKEVMIE